MWKGIYGDYSLCPFKVYRTMDQNVFARNFPKYFKRNGNYYLHSPRRCCLAELLLEKQTSNSLFRRKKTFFFNMMAADVSTTYLNISSKPNPIRKKHGEVPATNFTSQNCCCQQLKNHDSATIVGITRPIF